MGLKEAMDLAAVVVAAAGSEHLAPAVPVAVDLTGVMVVLVVLAVLAVLAVTLVMVEVLHFAYTLGEDQEL